MTMKFENARKLSPESAKRLRECLTALAEASGTDVHRCELYVTETGGLRVIVTSSRHDSEEKIAELLGRGLKAFFNGRFQARAKEGALVGEPTETP